MKRLLCFFLIFAWVMAGFYFSGILVLFTPDFGFSFAISTIAGLASVYIFLEL